MKNKWKYVKNEHSCILVFVKEHFLMLKKHLTHGSRSNSINDGACIMRKPCLLFVTISMF